jgi:hypothetical protein
MKKIPKSVRVLIALALLFVAAKGAWDVAYPSGTWRYRMTVTVETPEGLKTGSAVREVSVHIIPKLLPQMLPTVGLRGEAVVVDLGKRGAVFALLKGYKVGADYGADIPAYIFNPQKAYMTREGVRHMSRLKAEVRELESQWYPMFVRFRDPNDPKTVENLLDMKPCPDPVTHIPNNSVCLEKDYFEEAFGEGVRLKSVTIEMTDEPVTRSIVKQLVWLPDYYNKKFDGQRYHSAKSQFPFANQLSSGSFFAGDKK